MCSSSGNNRAATLGFCWMPWYSAKKAPLWGTIGLCRRKFCHLRIWQIGKVALFHTTLCGWNEPPSIGANWALWTTLSIGKSTFWHLLCCDQRPRLLMGLFLWLGYISSGFPPSFLSILEHSFKQDWTNRANLYHKDGSPPTSWP